MLQLFYYRIMFDLRAGRLFPLVDCSSIKYWLILLLIIGPGLIAWVAGAAKPEGLALSASSLSSPGPTLVLTGNPPVEPPGAISLTEQPDGQWCSYTTGHEIKALAVTSDSVWTATTGGVRHWSQAEGSYVKYTTTD